MLSYINAAESLYALRTYATLLLGCTTHMALHSYTDSQYSISSQLDKVIGRHISHILSNIRAIYVVECETELVCGYIACCVVAACVVVLYSIYKTTTPVHIDRPSYGTTQ